MSAVRCRTAIYRLYDKDGALLYVGIGQNPYARFKKHAKKDWWRKVTGKPAIVWYDSREEALIVEGHAIDEEHPLHNERKGASALGWATDLSPQKIAPHALDLRRKPFGQRVMQVEKAGSPLFAVEDGEPLVVLVPIDWYRRASEALGEPFTAEDADES